ncbi:MAG: hypothetical protein V4605_04680 [Pseudomonadota bacterium]
MKTSNKTIALALSGAFALSIGAATVNASENPFAITSLSSGYQVAEHHDEKMKDGKCGEGKCGAEKKEMKDGKCGEGKCGAEKKTDAKEMKDGKCGEGKCGAEKK